MFGGPPKPKPVELAPLPERVHELAAKLPSHLRMGTSSWSFAGWTKLVWDRPASARVLAKHGLAAYAGHPLFRAVGLDRTYYGPMSAEQLAALCEGLPEDFRFLVKAHAECTTVKFGERSWYRSRAGQRNELFLEPQYASETVVRPYMEGLGSRGGVLLFQFPAQHVPGGPRAFAHRLGDFLAALPTGPQYAVEIRNPDLLTPRYARTLERLGAAHCIVELPGVPAVDKQWEVTGGADRPAFDRLVDEAPGVRRAYAKMISATTQPAFLIVNNKAEGSSPLSIQRMAEQLAMRAP